MKFRLIGKIQNPQTFASGSGIRELSRLQRTSGIGKKEYEIKEALNKSIQDFSRPLVPDAALPPAAMQACIHAGESAQVENAIFNLLQNQ